MQLEEITRETELAFTLLTARASLEQHRLFRQATPCRQHLISRYFDTPMHVLGRSGWSVRLRHSGLGLWQQTVKGPSKGGSRPEIESVIDAPETLDTTRLQATPVWQMIDGSVHNLNPVFETDIERTVHALHLGGATIEAAFDEGKIRGFGIDRESPVHDLELEVKSGDIRSMLRVAVELALETPIMIQPSSKAQRGYWLITGAPPQAHKHDDVTLDKNAKTIDCFRMIIGDIIDHLWINLAAAYAGQVDGVHQIRVAVRRLRTALLMFRKLLHRDTIDAYDRHLQHYGRVFGAARDWDVFITVTLAEAQRAVPDAGWLDLIREAALDKQREAHQAVRRELEDRTFNSLILSVLAWTDDDSSLVTSEAMDQPVATVMPHLLSGLVKKVVQRQRRLNGSDDRLHALRKSTKRLRYACEFSESMYPAKKVKRFIDPCKDIQQALGEVNDVATTAHLMTVLVADKPALAPALAKLAAWLERRKEEAERGIPKLLKRLQRDRMYWT